MISLISPPPTYGRGSLFPCFNHPTPITVTHTHTNTHTHTHTHIYILTHTHTHTHIESGVSKSHCAKKTTPYTIFRELTHKTARQHNSLQFNLGLHINTTFLNIWHSVGFT